MHKQIFRGNLEELRRLLKEAGGAPETSQAAVAQYVCVSANGHFESYLQKSMINRFRSRCDANALRLIEKNIERYFNFKSDRVSIYFKNIWPTKADDVEKFLKANSEFSDAIGSIVGNKNQIGHSGRSDATIRRVDPWLETIILHIDDFDQVCFK
ncbi:MAG: hypothetical protein GY820_28500 [Gammaproteobacteria bacterium]|nr:hypothetical protein [Gammaproteobacteria bacterium]